MNSVPIFQEPSVQISFQLFIYKVHVSLTVDVKLELRLNLESKEMAEYNQKISETQFSVSPLGN
jgi:hypothetical protein